MAESSQGQIVCGRYTKGVLISQGAQANVYRGTGPDGEPVAIKQFHNNPDAIKYFGEEQTHLERIHSPYIPKLLAWEQSDDSAFLVMELVPGGDLANFLKKMNGEPLPIAVADRFMQQIVVGLNHSWTLGIIHRDLKPSNILLTEKSESANIKVGDFGVSKNAQESDPRSKVGTKAYMAPEVGQTSYDRRTDVWSLGVIYCEMLIGRQVGSTRQEVIDHFKEERSMPNIPESKADLIKKMLQVDPNKRLKDRYLFNLFRFETLREGPHTEYYEFSVVKDLASDMTLNLKKYHSEYYDLGTAELTALQILSDELPETAVNYMEEYSLDEVHCILQEECAGGSLRDFVQKHGPVNEHIVKKWLHDLLAVLRTLHHYDLLAMCLNPDSILLDREDYSATLQLRNLELSIPVGTRPKRVKVSERSVAYWAPEQLNGEVCTPATDYWALGGVLYFMLQCEDPTESLQPLRYTSPTCRDFVLTLLCPDAFARRCLDHPFLSESLDSLHSLSSFQGWGDQQLKDALANLNECIEVNDVVKAFDIVCSLQDLIRQRHDAKEHMYSVSQLLKSLKPLADLQKSKIQLQDG